MYQIKCDGHVLYDPREDNLIVNSPKCKLEVNTVGEASFSIYAKHPYYGHLQKMRSVFEILQDGDTIFKGRMTDDTKDFNNIKAVDLEGVMAYFNDSIVRPFHFPEDFSGDSGYNTAASSGNVVEFFLKWLIDNHNSQVQEFQQFKLGKVTVVDSNNYLSRASEDYLKTWEVLKTRLFDSSLGGYLCIRYEDDGNYIDYLEDFELTNTQKIKFGENLLDISNESDASETYSALIPLGKKKNEIDTASDDNSRLTIESLEDGDISEDIVKSGDTIYSRSAVEKYGFIYAPTSDTTWEDVTEAENLKTKGTAYLIQKAMKLMNTITIKAVDLHFSNEEIEGFRIYRYIDVESKPHDQEDSYRLTKLDIDIQNPQNTIIVIGDTSLTLTDINSGNKQSIIEKIEVIKNNTTEQSTEITEIQNTLLEQSTSVISTCEEIIISALESYVETSNYESFKETIQTQISLLSDKLNLKFTEAIQAIEDVDGDLQKKYNIITKFFTFEINGMTIGQPDNPYKIILDNDEIIILANDIIVQRFDAEGKSLIPELKVTRLFNLLGLYIDETDNTIDCEPIGGDL